MLHFDARLGEPGGDDFLRPLGLHATRAASFHQRIHEADGVLAHGGIIHQATICSACAASAASPATASTAAASFGAELAGFERVKQRRAAPRCGPWLSGHRRGASGCRELQVPFLNQGQPHIRLLTGGEFQQEVELLIHRLIEHPHRDLEGLGGVRMSRRARPAPRGAPAHSHRRWLFSARPSHRGIRASDARGCAVERRRTR